MIQYVIGVLMKMPFYWHLIYWFFFADVFLCFFCQYLDGMHGFIRDHQKIANLLKTKHQSITILSCFQQ